MPAKKSVKVVVRAFLKSLATDPLKLGSFIIDPEGVMDDDRIAHKYRAAIRNELSIQVARKLVTPPGECSVHLS